MYMHCFIQTGHYTKLVLMNIKLHLKSLRILWVTIISKKQLFNIFVHFVHSHTHLLQLGSKLLSLRLHHCSLHS